MPIPMQSTEELVDYAIESKKYLNIRDIPSKFMTARRFVTICKKDRSAVNWLFQYVDILSDDELLEVLCANSDGLSNVPAERWNKELLYHYLEHCVRNYKDTGFMDYMAKLPEELKDKVYYQCCCMTGGFYYSKIPEEMKKTVISWKLVTETIRRWDIAQKEGCLISYVFISMYNGKCKANEGNEKPGKTEEEKFENEIKHAKNYLAGAKCITCTHAKYCKKIKEVDPECKQQKAYMGTLNRVQRYIGKPCDGKKRQFYRVTFTL